MPIYLDRHEIHQGKTAEHVAKMHLEDLKIEHKFNCRTITYWCDEVRRTAFCLIEAPNKQAIQNMHNHAHGSVPHSIIEVESNIVESFLGRILDPEKSKNSTLNIINEPAFRVLMVFNIQRLSLIDVNYKQFIRNHGESIFEKAKIYKASIVKHKKNCFLASFDSVTNAISCAIDIQTIFNKQNSNTQHSSEMKLNIGVSAGVPITDKKGLFEDAVKTAERLSNIAKEQIVITSEVKDLYESENLNVFLDEKVTHTISSTDEQFLTNLMNYIDNQWNNTSLKIEDICQKLGCSKSKLYRQINDIVGISPNVFIKEYRLNEALKMLINQYTNISEIAFKTGFNSPAYFSKRFKETYGILPSNFIKQGIENI